MKYNLTFVQILRGFAAIAVLLFHIDADTSIYFNYELFSFKYGYLGVDFFFTLSGFIITYVHFKDIGKPPELKKFAIKRAIRIFPLYWIILVVTILVYLPGFEIKPSLNEALSLRSIEGWIVLFKNFILFPLPYDQMPIGVAWSLSYELVFYITFSFAIAFGWKFVKFALPLWLLIIFIYSRNIFPSTLLADVMIGPLILEFLFGCLAAYLLLHFETKIKTAHFIVAMLLTILLFAMYLSYHPFNRSSIIVIFFMGTIAGLIILQAAILDKRNKYRWLGLPLLILIGDASYSIYITHNLSNICLFRWAVQSLNIFALKEWQRDSLIITIALTSLLIGIIVHLLIEKPLLKFLKTRLNLDK